MSDQRRERRSNIVAGILVLCLVVAVACWLILRQQAASAAAAYGKRYVAYFDDSGRLAKGDVVSMAGRRVGRVISTGIVERQGRLQARVEFEITRGWIYDQGVPVDSVLRVRAGGMVSRPGLVIRTGDSDQRLSVGGDWPRAESLSNPDPLARYRDEIRAFDQGVDQFNAVVGNRQLFEDIKNYAREIRGQIEVEGGRLLEGLAAARRIARDIFNDPDSIQSAVEAVKAERDSITDGVRETKDLAARLDAGLSGAQDEVRALRRDLAGVNAVAGGTADGLESPGVRGFFVWVRRYVASWTAANERARFDPKQFGKLPPFRIWRRFFNSGGSPLEAADKVEGEAKEPPPAKYKPPPREPFENYSSQ